MEVSASGIQFSNEVSLADSSHMAIAVTPTTATEQGKP